MMTIQLPELQIATPFLGLHDKTILATVIKTLAQDGVRVRLMPGSLRQAHLLVFDLDSKYGQQILRVSRAGQVKLVFSDRPEHGPNLIALAKPPAAAALRDVLRRLFSKMGAQLAEQQTETEASAAAGTQTLFSVLLHAKEQGGYLRIQGPGCPMVFVDGLQRVIATSATAITLRKLTSVPFAELRIQALTRADYASASQGLLLSPLYAVLWTAGVECSHGVLLPGHNAYQAVKLRAWPNFSRDNFVASHLKIAAALARQPLNLIKLAELTQLPFEDIVNFYNASYAVDLIDAGAKPATAEPEQRSVSNEARALFSRIAQRLSLRG